MPIGAGREVEYNFGLSAELHGNREQFNRPLAYSQRALKSVRRDPYPDGEARDSGGLGEPCLRGTRSDGPRLNGSQ